MTYTQLNTLAEETYTEKNYGLTASDLETLAAMDLVEWQAAQAEQEARLEDYLDAYAQQFSGIAAF